MFPNFPRDIHNIHSTATVASYSTQDEEEMKEASLELVPCHMEQRTQALIALWSSIHKLFREAPFVRTGAAFGQGARVDGHSGRWHSCHCSVLAGQSIPEWPTQTAQKISQQGITPFTRRFLQGQGITSPQMARIIRHRKNIQWVEEQLAVIGSSLVQGKNQQLVQDATQLHPRENNLNVDAPLERYSRPVLDLLTEEIICGKLDLEKALSWSVSFFRLYFERGIEETEEQQERLLRIEKLVNTCQKIENKYRRPPSLTLVESDCKKVKKIKTFLSKKRQTTSTKRRKKYWVEHGDLWKSLYSNTNQSSKNDKEAKEFTKALNRYVYLIRKNGEFELDSDTKSDRRFKTHLRGIEKSYVKNQGHKQAKKSSLDSEKAQKYIDSLLQMKEDYLYLSRQADSKRDRSGPLETLLTLHRKKGNLTKSERQERKNLKNLFLSYLEKGEVAFLDEELGRCAVPRIQLPYLHQTFSPLWIWYRSRNLLTAQGSPELKVHQLWSSVAEREIPSQKIWNEIHSGKDRIATILEYQKAQASGIPSAPPSLPLQKETKNLLHPLTPRLKTNKTLFQKSPYSSPLKKWNHSSMDED